jgi:alpha-amylase
LEENNPTKFRQQSFYTIAEVYNYGISGGQDFDFETKNKLFQNGFNNMINFEFKWDAQKTEFIFSKYSNKLNNDLKGYSVLNLCLA